MVETLMGAKPRLAMPNYDDYVGTPVLRDTTLPPKNDGPSGSPLDALMEMFGMNFNVGGAQVKPRIKPGKHYGVEAKWKF